MSDQTKTKKRVLSGRSKALLSVFLLFLIYTLSGFFLFPWLLKTQAEKRLPEFFQRSVTIDQVRFNPFALRLQIDGFVVQGRQSPAPLLKIDSLLADCAGFLSLANRALVLEKIDVQGPYLKIVKNEDATFNFSDLLQVSSKPDEKTEESAETKGSGFRFSLNNISIGGGIVEFADQSLDIFHWLNDINIGLPQISNLPHLVETHVKPSFAAVINGTPLEVGGQSKPFAKTLETDFGINIDGLDLAYYLSYLPQGRNFTVSDGTLTTRLNLVYLQPENGAPSLTLSGTARINNLLVSGLGEERPHRFVFLPELKFDFGPGNLLDKELFLNEIVIRKPEVNLLFQPDGVFYLPLLVAAGSEDSVGSSSGSKLKSGAEPEAHSGETESFVFKLDRLFLEEGVVGFRDERVEPPFSAQLASIELELKDFSTVGDHSAYCNVKLQSDTGETLLGDGNFSVNPVNCKLLFALDKLSPARYAAYYKEYFAGNFDSGSLRLSGELLFAQKEGGEPELQLQELACGLSDMKISSPDGEPVFELPNLQIAQSRIDLNDRECKIGSLLGEKGSLSLLRRSDNSLNLTDFMPVKAGKKSLSKGISSPYDSGVIEKSGSAWHLFLENGRLSDFKIIFRDQVPVAKTEIEIAKINLDIARIGTAAGESGDLKLDLCLAQKGQLSLKGPVSLNPLQTDFAVELNKVPLKTFQSYLGDHLDLVIVKGEAEIAGDFSIRQEDSAAAALEFSGKAAIADLKTIDGWSGSEFLSLRKLSLGGLFWRSQPPALSVLKCSVGGLRANFVKEADGRSNLELMLVEKEVNSGKLDPVVASAEEAEAKSAPAIALEFKKIVLDKSFLAFVDRSLSPVFKLSLDNLSGKVVGLTSLGEKPAEAKFAGQLNGQAPVSVAGFIDPLAEDLYVDLKIDGQGIGMTDLTPYSGKFVGYAIGKGKISFDLACKVEQQKLVSSNAIFLDQFDFGSRVESSEALNLPVKLAVSLLRDRQGEIHLNLPVKGELDDPEFSLGGIVVKVFVNLITKAITSPFALIGSLAGGGEELNLVSFAAGQENLDETALGRLDKLSGVLYERPGLKVEITGRADAESDRQALQEERFKKLLQVQKFKEVLGRNPELQSPEQVVVKDDEFFRYLWRAYKAAPFAKEKNLLRMVKKIEPAEQERLLRDFVKVSDDDLTLLARNRARGVMAYIVKKGPVESQRLFLVDPQVLSGDPAAVEKARQVEMKIK